MPYIDVLMDAPQIPKVKDPEDQAQHAVAPTAGIKQDATTIVLALIGFMILFYLLHIVERWAKKA